METATWRGKVIVAEEIAKDYLLEKQIRAASGHKELRCPDASCIKPTVKYCNGDYKGAYFAHLDATHCDYERFEKDNNEITKTTRKKVFDQLRERGYDVRMTVKLLEHHYAQLAVVLADSRTIAIEFGKKALSANRIAYLEREYKAKNIEMKCLVISSSVTEIDEQHTQFVNRYALNESRNQDLLVLNPYNMENITITQYKLDSVRYEVDGKEIVSENYPRIFQSAGTIKDLDIVDGELTLNGFATEYQEWHQKKVKQFNRKKIELQREKEEWLAREQRAKEDRRKAKEKQESLNNMEIEQDTYELDYYNYEEGRALDGASKEKSREKRREEILPLLEQQESEARDCLGERWVKCKWCGFIETTDKFASYGGQNEMTKGICLVCSRK